LIRVKSKLNFKLSQAVYPKCSNLYLSFSLFAGRSKYKTEENCDLVNWKFRIDKMVFNSSKELNGSKVLGGGLDLNYGTAKKADG